MNRVYGLCKSRNHVRIVLKISVLHTCNGFNVVAKSAFSLSSMNSRARKVSILIPHSGALQVLCRWNFLVARPNRRRIPSNLDAGKNRHRLLSLYLFPRQRQAQNHKHGRQTPVGRKTKVKSSTTVEGNANTSLVHPKQSTVKFVSLILSFQAFLNC